MNVEFGNRGGFIIVLGLEWLVLCFVVLEVSRRRRKKKGEVIDYMF